ncbi:hypothetical protein [Methylomonas sp. TEB]|uniref:hypothetical protein n=1 Tax=Methylomonas sp. TEB TaxID=3398229 RepID=UPI0039F53798
MHHSNEMLSQELVAMAKNDLSVREALVADGSLGHALYHPYMEAVHISNAARLAAIIEQYGWPVHSLVGEEGAWAACWSRNMPSAIRHSCVIVCLC